MKGLCCIVRLTKCFKNIYILNDKWKTCRMLNFLCVFEAVEREGKIIAEIMTVFHTHNSHAPFIGGGSRPRHWGGRGDPKDTSWMLFLILKVCVLFLFSSFSYVLIYFLSLVSFSFLKFPLFVLYKTHCSFHHITISVSDCFFYSHEKNERKT